jgi:hypothetical protein
LEPPISTHSNFDLNETMHYPAVTFCREPAFKRDILKVKNYLSKRFSKLYLNLFRNTTSHIIRQSQRVGQISHFTSKPWKISMKKPLTAKKSFLAHLASTDCVKMLKFS